MPLLAVAVLGPDRPGVVAALTEVLLAGSGNLEDASMTLLHGRFAMSLVVDGPLAAAEVRERLAGPAGRLDLLVSVAEVTEPPDRRPASAPGATPCVLRLHGADRPGLVHRTTALLADARVNITDLTTRLSGGLYVLLADVDVPAGVDLGQLGAAVAALGAELGVEAVLAPVDADVL